MALFEPGPVDPLRLHAKTGPTVHHAFDPHANSILQCNRIGCIAKETALHYIAPPVMGGHRNALNRHRELACLTTGLERIPNI